MLFFIAYILGNILHLFCDTILQVCIFALSLQQTISLSPTYDAQ
jgi:hypothetical protein